MSTQPRKRVVIIDDDPNFGVIAWFAGCLFFWYVVVIVMCVLEHGG